MQFFFRLFNNLSPNIVMVKLTKGQWVNIIEFFYKKAACYFADSKKTPFGILQPPCEKCDDQYASPQQKVGYCKWFVTF